MHGTPIELTRRPSRYNFKFQPDPGILFIKVSINIYGGPKGLAHYDCESDRAESEQTDYRKSSLIGYLPTSCCPQRDITAKSILCIQAIVYLSVNQISLKSIHRLCMKR